MTHWEQIEEDKSWKTSASALSRKKSLTVGRKYSPRTPPPHRLKHSSLTITLKHFLRGISAGHLDGDLSGAGERGGGTQSSRACSACEKQKMIFFPDQSFGVTSTAGSWRGDGCMWVGGWMKHRTQNVDGSRCLNAVQYRTAALISLLIVNDQTHGLFVNRL